MEEVDSIIIHTLRLIGCELDEAVDSLKEFSTEIVVEATVRMLRLINPSLELSHHLPPSMSARFRVGSVLAQACTDLGYQGEIGYQTFLYSGESDIRKVFIFLIEKLPKESEKTSDEPIGAIALLDRAISSNIHERLQMPWLPSFCQINGGRWKNNIWYRESSYKTSLFHSCKINYPKGLEDLNNKIPKDFKLFYSYYQPLVTSQPPTHTMILPSLLECHANDISAANQWETEWNQLGLSSRLTENEYRIRKKQRIQKKINSVIQQELQKLPKTMENLPKTISIYLDKGVADAKTKGSRFTHSEKLQFTSEDKIKTISENSVLSTLRPADTHEEKKQKEEEVQQLQSELNEINKQIEELQVQNRKITAGIQQLEQETIDFESKSKDLEDAYKVKKQTLSLLPNANDNLEKLQGVIESNTKRLIILANQWEKHRVPLIEEYRQLKEVNFNKLSEAQRKIEEIKNIREKMKDLAEDAKHKEELHKQLIAEYEKTTKDINRAAYTRRILEIVGNIKKQKQDIDKVLIDTKEVQKEINQLTGKLDRTFTVTDELVFRDAKKDETVRKAYKYLAALHENCSQLIKTVEETGAIMREIRDLEDQIENESQKKVIANLERIMADYKQMKQENSSLLIKLKEQDTNN